jgi:PKD repeat protein
MYAFDLNSVAPSATSITVVTNGRTVNLSAPAAGSSLFRYAWDFGDGNSSVGRSVSHTYAEDGGYNITLSITNPAGDSATTSRIVDIQTAAPSEDNTVLMIGILALVALVVTALIFIIKRGK